MTPDPFTATVDAAWADALGCPVELLQTPGVHVVDGGDDLRRYNGVYLARLDAAVLVYTPQALRTLTATVLAGMPAVDAFTPDTCRSIAGEAATVLGPSRHAFVDPTRFRPARDAAGERLEWDDPALDRLRRACGEDEWAEGGFSGDGLAYGIKVGGQLLAAGNMTPFRGCPADVGLATHPGYRGRGLGRRLASHMVSDRLPTANLVRYRALLTNGPSLAVARSLGFVGRGDNLAVRLG